MAYPVSKDPFIVFICNNHSNIHSNIILICQNKNKTKKASEHFNQRITQSKVSMLALVIPLPGTLSCI